MRSSLRSQSFRPGAWIGVSLGWVAAFTLSLYSGAVHDADWNLISQLRLPRAVLASAVGAGLAVAGAVFQALFSNPLCEPYILGISSGASLGAVIGITLGFGATLAGAVGSAFAGSLVFLALLFLLVLRSDRWGSTSGNRVLLCGVMLGYFGASGVSLWMSLADSGGIVAAIYWLLGDLSRARPDSARGVSFSVAFLVILLGLGWRDLDSLLLGEENAVALGVNVTAVRRRFIFIASLMVAVCVSSSGMIGFVGLIVPHLARRWVGSLHRQLIPFCAVLGALSLTLADGVSKRLFDRYEIPVGVITALLGAPLFIFLLSRRKEVA